MGSIIKSQAKFLAFELGRFMFHDTSACTWKQSSDQYCLFQGAISIFPPNCVYLNLFFSLVLELLVSPPNFDSCIRALHLDNQWGWTSDSLISSSSMGLFSACLSCEVPSWFRWGKLSNIASSTIQTATEKPDLLLRHNFTGRKSRSLWMDRQVDAGAIRYSCTSCALHYSGERHSYHIWSCVYAFSVLYK